MKRFWVKVIIAMLATALLGVGVAQAADEGRSLPRPAKAPLLFIMTAPGAALVAVVEGTKAVFKPTTSPLENPVSGVCRGLNTTKDQLLGNFVDFGKEFCTPFSGVQYADPSQLNETGLRATQRGPVTQVLETAACAIPPTMVATGVTAPFCGITFTKMAFVQAGTGGIGGVGIAEGANCLERVVTKAIFNKAY